MARDQIKAHYYNMTSWDDCGVVLDNMHDSQRHLKTWFPENRTPKQKQDDEDIEESHSKRWLSYSDTDDQDSISEFE